MRGLIGDGLEHFPRETRETVTQLAGKVLIGHETYDIVRPLVTTVTAMIDIAGSGEVNRLPASRAMEGKPLTYTNWLLEKLHLPRINVPIAPTQPDSDTSPLSINDYMMYCHLKQDEIDSSVFGHTNHFKNNKRRFVFEVVYGKYDVEVSRLHDQRREVYSELQRLKGQTKTIEEFVTGTPFENRAVIERDLHEAQTELEAVIHEENETAGVVMIRSQTLVLKERLITIEGAIEELQRRLQFEQSSKEQKTKLIGQLQTQSARLTRSIVAGVYLLDYDFIVCPRCSSSVNAERGKAEVCYLCLQHPTPQITREDIINEQDRIERQISETRELVAMHTTSIKEIEKKLEEMVATRDSIANELDQRTKSYISDIAEKITQAAEKRTMLQERMGRFNDYLELYKRQDTVSSRIAQLESHLTDLDTAIEAAMRSESDFNERVRFLEEQFNAILHRIRAPRYPNPGPTVIDRKTYLPIYDGRRFDELQSQGLQVMVNVAHAVAHQLTALHFGLTLPNILLIDGLTGNMGYEGLDLERVEAIYEFLMEIVEGDNTNLQIIVADNSVPNFAKRYVLVEFTDEDKLIPQHFLSKERS